MIRRFKKNIFERAKKNHADLEWNYPEVLLRRRYWFCDHFDNDVLPSTSFRVTQAHF